MVTEEQGKIVKRASDLVFTASLRPFHVDRHTPRRDARKKTPIEIEDEGAPTRNEKLPGMTPTPAPSPVPIDHFDLG